MFQVLSPEIALAEAKIWPWHYCLRFEDYGVRFFG
jgi:hypothetical protein